MQFRQRKRLDPQGLDLQGLDALQQVGLGYRRLSQHATELSGGEAQRIKLGTEPQRTLRGNTLYILDGPTTGLYPADVSMRIAQLNGLVDAGNTLTMVQHFMLVASNSDRIINVGPGAGNERGLVVVQATPAMIKKCGRVEFPRT